MWIRLKSLGISQLNFIEMKLMNAIFKIFNSSL